MCTYSIYPSLLDAFYWAKRKGTWDELLDKINRTQIYERSESAEKGVRFENLINSILDGEVIENTEFNPVIVDKIATKLCNNIGRQKYYEDVIETEKGKIKLYGFTDYEYPDLFVDLKTCTNYKPNKYYAYSQQKVYPLIGHKIQLNYLITDFNDVYVEKYPFTETMHKQLIFEVNEFIEWLEVNRHKITDTKIFTV